jgi:hypothetical protein
MAPLWDEYRHVRPVTRAAVGADQCVAEDHFIRAPSPCSCAVSMRPEPADIEAQRAAAYTLRMLNRPKTGLRFGVGLPTSGR